MQNNLPKGFISIDDAITLINKDTRGNPLVDIKYLILHNIYYRAGGNARIPLYQPDESGKIPVNQNGDLVSTKETNITFESDYDVLRFKDAIKKHYYAATSKEIDLDKIGLKHYTSGIDDEKNTKGNIRVNPDSKIGYGDTING